MTSSLHAAVWLDHQEARVFHVGREGFDDLQFVRYLREHDPALEAKVVGLETVDHPTDAQLVAYVKRYFHVADARVR